MNPDASSWRPEPEPQNALERLMRRSAQASDKKTRVIINPGLSAQMVLQPEGVAALVAGEYTDRTPGKREEMRVMPVPADKVPAKLRQGIRVFCARRRVPIGVYVFHPFDETTAQWDTAEFRFVLWLRHGNDHFYNDFSLLVGKLLPEHCRASVAILTSEQDAANLGYIQTCTPIWPAMPGGK